MWGLAGVGVDLLGLSARGSLRSPQSQALEHSLVSGLIRSLTLIAL